MDSPAEAYLRELRHALRRDPLLARRVIEEARDHLTLIADEERRHGMSQHEAEEAAVRRFGPAGPLAVQFDGFSLPLKIMVGLSAGMTLMVALWLITVIVAILPARDPARIPLWTGLAAGFLIYSGLTLAYLIVGPKQPVLRATVLALSVVAIALGAYGVVRMATATSGHFEGYLLLMGLILAGHGIVALIDTAMSAAIARRIAAH
ncbi:MAG: hypothetical protein HYR74_11215 [Candidatus Eisenbacteria bacterium]|nr:hypothetical protein [Candidatus Eisenbacteria bacterium]